MKKIMVVEKKEEKSMNYYMLKGDLIEITIQREELLKRGIETGPENKYPVVKTEKEYIKALKILFDNVVDGFWHFKEDFIKYNVCTAEQLNTKIRL